MAFTVMIVDDSITTRKVIKKVINLSGMPINKLIEASNGKEALSKLAEEWIDIVITDINMPEMNGIELINKMQENDVYKAIPIIVISTEGRDDIIQQLKKKGIKGYIQKPFQPEKIKQLILEILGVKENGGYNEGTEECDF